MPISRAEQISYTCAACASTVWAEVWTLVDAAERADLAQALAAGALNMVSCSHCGDQMQLNVPLLFHDPVNSRVYFAVPPYTDQHRWREQAQTLLYELVASLPEDARRPYLGDVQVEHELDGVRRAVQRHTRYRRGRVPAQTQSTNSQPEVVAVPERATSPEQQHSAPGHPPSSLLFEAAHALLRANDIAEVKAATIAYPLLLSDAGDQLLRQWADDAAGQGDRELVTALQEMRRLLNRMRTSHDDGGWLAPSVEPQKDNTALSQPTEISSLLTPESYQALLQCASQEELLKVVRTYPLLLEPQIDEELLGLAEAALDEGNERLAFLIEDRREQLASLSEGSEIKD